MSSNLTVLSVEEASPASGSLCEAWVWLVLGQGAFASAICVVWGGTLGPGKSPSMFLLLNRGLTFLYTMRKTEAVEEKMRHRLTSGGSVQQWEQGRQVPLP